jgi:hypothetical protein
MNLLYLYHLNINDSLQCTLHSVSYVILLQVLEIVNQAHDVPFGSSFEVHSLLPTCACYSGVSFIKNAYMHMSVLGLGRLCNHRTTIHIHSKQYGFGLT